MHTKSSLMAQLERMAIDKEGTILVHSSMKSIGQVDGGADTVLDALSEYMKQGLLVLPTHTWSYINADNPKYHVESSPVCVGLLPELFRKRPGVIRSYHPTHSVAALGAEASSYTAGDERVDTPCNRGSVWGKLLDREAKILLVGVDLRSNTFIHGIEEWIDIPGRLTDDHQPLVTVLGDGREIPVPSRRHCGQSSSENFWKVEDLLRRAGAVSDGTFGNAAVLVCDTVKMNEVLSRLLRMNPDLFSNNEPLPMIKWEKQPLSMTREAFEKARGFIMNHAVGPDRAMFEYHFESAARHKVIDELAAFQNEDGGFGSLEYDIELETSNVMATLRAFQYLRTIKADSADPMVKKGIGYLVNACIRSELSWPPVPAEVSYVPHAPWWNDNPRRLEWDEEELTWERQVNMYNPNTNAEIAGYLHQFRDLVPADFPLGPAIQIAIDKLQELDEIDMHAFLCYLTLWGALEGEHKEAIAGELRQRIRNAIEPDPAKWSGYSSQPMLFVDSPGSLVTDLISDELGANLDYLIVTQLGDGSWAPSWSWGVEAYEEAWQRAKVKWKGYLTVQHLIKLKAFGRIEHLAQTLY